MSNWWKKIVGEARISRNSSCLIREYSRENRYFDVFVEYAKADVEDILIRITAMNRGPEAATLHLLPSLWFRNTWSWERILVIVGANRGLRGLAACAPNCSTGNTEDGGYCARDSRNYCSARTKRTISGCTEARTGRT